MTVHVDAGETVRGAVRDKGRRRREEEEEEEEEEDGVAKGGANARSALCEETRGEEEARDAQVKKGDRRRGDDFSPRAGARARTLGDVNYAAE